MKKYYTLLGRDAVTDMKWSIVFGDYDRDCVEDEMVCEDESSFGFNQHRIISCADSQAAIDAAVAAVNAEVAA